MSANTNFTGKIIDYFSNAPLAAVNAVFGIVRPIVSTRNKAAEKAAAPVKGKHKPAAQRGRKPKTFPPVAPPDAAQPIDGAAYREQPVDHAPLA